MSDAAEAVRQDWDAIECPLWVVKVRCPVSEHDPRAVIEIPAAFFEEGPPGAVVTVLVDPHDRKLAATLDALADVRVGTKFAAFRAFDHALKLTTLMRDELYAGLLTVIVAGACECPAETLDLGTVQ